MFAKEQELRRKKSFLRNNDLESFLNEINNNLFISESKLLSNVDLNNKLPLIFLIGPLRSGSTLMMQWLASLGIIAYPTNLLSRFYMAPIIGSKIQLLLTDKKYNFRNEIRDFNSSIDFVSENGKTKGALSPNEFWYFWRRFLPFDDLGYLTTKELYKRVDIKTLKKEFAGIIDVFQKPFALKSMILNYNIDFLDNLFEKSIFIYTKRNPYTNIASALDARKRQLGSITEWYSFKIPEYPKLIKINDPIEQTAGQIFFINKAVSLGLDSVKEEKKIIVQYEDFCKSPEKYYNELITKLNKQGCSLKLYYKGVKNFKISRNTFDKEIINAYNKYKK